MKLQNPSNGEHFSAKLAKSAAGATTALTGKSALSKVKKHPLLLLGTGIVIGFLAHKYRKEIIATAIGIADRGKDFVLQQKENLEDLVAEAQEDEPQA